MSRDQTFTEAIKVIRASTEIVSSIAERGIPGLRNRVDELESRGRALEQTQRKTGSVVESLTRVVGAVLPSAPSIPTSGTSDEAAMLAARRAARAAQTAPSSDV